MSEIYRDVMVKFNEAEDLQGHNRFSYEGKATLVQLNTTSKGRECDTVAIDPMTSVTLKPGQITILA